MHKHLHDITPAATSYEMGMKRVLLSANESGCSITQIAIIDLKAGEESAMHIHPDLQDAFYILDGTLEVTINGVAHSCKKDDFLFIEQLNTYQLHAITDVRMLAMGCVIESQRTKLYPREAPSAARPYRRELGGIGSREFAIHHCQWHMGRLSLA